MGHPWKSPEESPRTIKTRQSHKPELRLFFRRLSDDAGRVLTDDYALHLALLGFLFFTFLCVFVSHEHSLPWIAALG